MELAQDSGLKPAIPAFIENTRLDKDMPLTWETLKTTFLREFGGLKRIAVNALVENIMQFQHSDCPHQVQYAQNLLGSAIGLRPQNKAPSFDVHYNNQDKVTRKSLQEVLDLFHQEFTPLTLITHLNDMIKNNQLSILDPISGCNIIWQLLGAAGREELNARNIDTSTIDDAGLLFKEGRGATLLGIAYCLQN